MTNDDAKNLQAASTALRESERQTEIARAHLARLRNDNLNKPQVLHLQDGANEALCIARTKVQVVHELLPAIEEELK